MIYTVTLNPALDYHLKSENLEFGRTNRAEDETLTIGGKGINVSVVLKELGCESTALGFVAGFTGKYLEQTLKQQGIKTDFLELEKGNTRINVKLSSGAETEINAKGPTIEEKDIAGLKEKLNGLQSSDVVVLAGSVPCGVDSSIYAELLASVPKGVLTVVDASGQALIKALPCKPFLIKPNHDELEEVVGFSLKTEAEIVSAAKLMQEKGALNVLVSLGAEGALLLTVDGNVYKETAKDVDVKSTVGAGDSMVAGFISALGNGYKTALKVAVAVGTATASVSGLAKREDIEKFL